MSDDVKSRIRNAVESVAAEAETRKKEALDNAGARLDETMDEMQKAVDKLDLPPSVPGPMHSIGAGESEYVSNISKSMNEYLKDEED